MRQACPEGGGGGYSPGVLPPARVCTALLARIVRHEATASRGDGVEGQGCREDSGQAPEVTQVGRGRDLPSMGAGQGADPGAVSPGWGRP